MVYIKDWRNAAKLKKITKNQSLRETGLVVTKNVFAQTIPDKILEIK